jgi:general stress protein YciG
MVRDIAADVLLGLAVLSASADVPGDAGRLPETAVRWFAEMTAGKYKRTKEVTMPSAQVKDEKTYQKLRDKGESKGKSARIANAAAGSSRSEVGRKGGRSGSYDDWSKQDLVQRAKEIGIKGRSTMTKAELIKALRDH